MTPDLWICCGLAAWLLLGIAIGELEARDQHRETE